MKRTMICAVIALAAAVACKPDPAKAVKIVSAPPAPPAPIAVLPPWQPGNCTLQPEKSGSSTFVAEGPCAIRQTGDVKCRSLTDDMHVLFLRKAKGEATVSVYINVETYHGPGDYNNTQIFLTYQDGSSYYHWSSDSTRITVSPGEKSVVLPGDTLRAEPPNEGMEIISGKLHCGAKLDSTITNPKG
jgi:hypothetical protein